MTTGTGAFEIAEPAESLRTRLWENFKGGNLGSLPVAVGLTLIVILFGFTAQNFFTAVNFNNIIVQMTGVTMLAYGVVFVLLLGEIDLSIAFLSGIVGVAQTEQVLALVKRLGEQGLAVILISHNLNDVFAVADRITVLRLGRNVGVFDRKTTTQEEVVAAITSGRPTKVAEAGAV